MTFLKGMSMELIELLTNAVDLHASDLHLSSGAPPIVRIDGDLTPLNTITVSDHTLLPMLHHIMTDQQHHALQNRLDIDFAFELPDLARFRVNVFYQRQGIAAVFRVIPAQIMSLSDIGIAAIYPRIVSCAHGLVLVTGATGSGKSTTLAAIIDAINQTCQRHILTIEDPIEFIHRSQRCLLTQREVGKDTQGFDVALRSALREDPDIILVGELRDLQTIRLALTAAETGHLVLASLHTSSAPKTINRLVDVFPAEEKALVRTLLSESLQMVISQVLLKKQGGGRMAAFEIMTCTAAIRNLIREGKVAQMYSAIQTGQAEGMQTLEQHIGQLIRAGLLERDQL